MSVYVGPAPGMACGVDEEDTSRISQPMCGGGAVRGMSSVCVFVLGQTEKGVGGWGLGTQWGSTSMVVHRLNEHTKHLIDHAFTVRLK